MIIDDIEIHHLICDHLNLNCDISSTDVLHITQTPTSVDVIVSCGEVGKVHRKFEININFSELSNMDWINDFT